MNNVPAETYGNHVFTATSTAVGMVYLQKWQYIDENPARWQDDCYYTLLIFLATATCSSINIAYERISGKRKNTMENKILIRRYEPKDADSLFLMMEREGDEWKDYYHGAGRQKYQQALANSIAYLLFERGRLCGYLRCRDDDGYGVYIYDLLVDKSSRGKEYGRLLMEQVCHDFPEDIVYVMSDVNPYYAKLGYKVEGTIFIVKTK